MRPLDLAMAYMDIFYGGGPLEGLADILAGDLRFEGPLYTFDTAAGYIDSLREAPPVGCSYENLRAFEQGEAVCLVYTFVKAGVRTPMSQVFEVCAGRIAAILLIFDTGPFATSL